MPRKNRPLPPISSVYDDIPPFGSTDEQVAAAGFRRVLNVPDRDEFRAAAWEKYNPGRSSVSSDEFSFMKGFDAGENYGYTFGFQNGANEAIRGLTGVPDRAMRQREEYTQRGNEHGIPRTKLEEINQDQLTAELVQVLSAYAVMPTVQKVRACLDAMRSLGVKLVPSKDLDQP